MPSPDNTPTDEPSGQEDRGDELLKEAEVLAKVRDVARKIVEKVNKALGDTSTHSSLPTEEKKPLE